MYLEIAKAAAKEIAEQKVRSEEESLQTPDQGTSETGSADSLPGQSGVVSLSRVLVLPAPTPEELKHTLDHVRKEVPELNEEYRQHYEMWVRVYRQAGWADEYGERAAYYKLLTTMPRKSKGDGDLVVPEEVFD